MSSRTVSCSSNLTVAPAMFWGILLASLAVRLYAVIISPLEPSVDEAQYWLWSTRFDFGYYTKPPLTSWIIGLSHGLFGHHEWAVRLPAPWLHLATSLVLWRAADWLAGPAAGRIAAIIWMTLPSIALGSFVISTDTPLLLCWSAGVLALVGVLTGRLREHRGMLLAGGAFGAAMLAKYAAIYGLAGLALFVLATSVLSRSKDRQKVIGWQKGHWLARTGAVRARYGRRCQSQHPVESRQMS